MDEPKPTTEELLARMVGLLERIEQRLAKAANETPPDAEAVTVTQACEMLGCRTTRLYALLRDGHVKSLEKVGRERRLDRASVEAFRRDGPQTRGRTKRPHKAPSGAGVPGQRIRDVFK